MARHKELRRLAEREIIPTKATMTHGESPHARIQSEERPEERRLHGLIPGRASVNGLATGRHDHRIWHRRAVWGLALLVASVGLLYLPLIFRTAVTGDEFRFLSDIHGLLRGDLAGSVQSFHVHLFRWLPAVVSNEIDQVIVGRLAYSALLLISCSFIFLIARRFLSSTASLFVILCYFAFGEVILTANSFRYDGLSVFFLLASLAVMLRSNRTAALAASGVMVAVALMVTVKSVFYLPTLIVVALLTRSSTTWARRLGDLALFTVACLTAFLVLFALHHSYVQDSVVEVATGVQSAGTRVFILDRLFPTRNRILRTFIANAFIWLFIAFGIVSLLSRLRKEHQRREAVLLLSLLLPLGSLLFYRNAFAYYYVFLMPAVLVVAGVRFDEVFSRAFRGHAKVALPFLVLMVASIMLTFAVNYRSVLNSSMVSQNHINEGQRKTIEAVHQIFPDPVPYIDAKSMISSFPKVGFFMSSWGFENYHDAGVPIFRTLLQHKQPRFLLANHDALVIEDEAGATPLTVRRALLHQDRRTLRENFIPHWGAVFVAGKRLAMNPGATQEIEIIIGGPYTVESDSPVVIDGTAYSHGSVVNLRPAVYTVKSYQPGVLILRWGHHLYRPSDTPPVLWRPVGAEVAPRRGQVDEP
jgi:hypothetical protein